MSVSRRIELSFRRPGIALTSRWVGLFLLALLTAGCSDPDPPEPAVQEPPIPAVSPPPSPTPLPDEKTEQIRADEQHRYAEHLERGASLYLRIEQHGVDVRIEITRAAEILRCVDLRIGSEGVEEVWWIAPESALYGISIIAAGAGSYTVIAARQPSPTADQTLRSRAQDAASKAMGGHQCGKAAALDTAKAAELWNESDDTWQEALAWAEAGRTAEPSDQKEAVAWLSRALELFRELDRPGQQTRVLLRRAQTFKGLGQLRRALADLHQAIELSTQHQDLRREARGRNDLAVLHLQRGDFDKAIANYGRAVDLWHQMGRGNEAKALNGLAEVYMRLGEMGQARAHLDRALKINDPHNYSRTLMLSGWWHYLEKDADGALDSYQDAWRYSSSRNDRRSAAGLFDRMGSAHVLQRDWLLAELRYKQALAILEPKGPRLDLAHTLSNLAALSLENDGSTEGLTYCSRALEIFRRQGDRDSESHALWIRARLHLALDDLHSAQKDLADAIDLLENLRQTAGPPTFRASFLAERIEIHRLYVEVLMTLHQEQGDRDWDLRALNASERARARSLLDLLSEAGIDRQEVAPEWLDQERWLTAEIAALDTLASTGQDFELRRTAERHLEERLREREALLQRMRQASQSASPLSPLRTLEVREVSKLLDDDTLLLTYGFGSKHAFLWWIDSSGRVGSSPLGEVNRIEQWAEDWSHLLSDPDRDWDWRLRGQRARDLRDVLLGPATKAIGRARRLVIVGDGALRSLPFAALPALDDDGKYLIATHEIVYLSSASTLALMRQRIENRPLAPEPLFAVGDPVYDLRDDRLEDPLRNKTPGKSDRLKHSEIEVQQILAVAAPDCQSCALLGFDANITMFQATDLSPYRILHFAAHSKIDLETPDLSAIRLSCYDRTGKKQDNHLLSFHRIFHLDLPAELVVLSACSTALGEELPGEGLIDLSRAFNHAGIPRSVMTLWDVQDKSTSILMSRFYEGLFQRRLPPAAALRHAQLSMIDDGWEPYQWAPFVLQGEWRPFMVLDADD